MSDAAPSCGPLTIRSFVRIPSFLILVIGLIWLTACTTTSGQAAGPGGGRGRGRGAAVQVQTATVERISIERRADLSGTLVSPDQAKVSSEVAGIVRDVTVNSVPKFAPAIR